MSKCLIFRLYRLQTLKDVSVVTILAINILWRLIGQFICVYRSAWPNQTLPRGHTQISSLLLIVLIVLLGVIIIGDVIAVGVSTVLGWEFIWDDSLRIAIFDHLLLCWHYLIWIRLMILVVTVEVTQFGAPVHDRNLSARIGTLLLRLWQTWLLFGAVVFLGSSASSSFSLFSWTEHLMSSPVELLTLLLFVKVDELVLNFVTEFALRILARLIILIVFVSKERPSTLI